MLLVMSYGVILKKGFGTHLIYSIRKLFIYLSEAIDYKFIKVETNII